MHCHLLQSSPSDPVHELDAGPHEAGRRDAVLAGRAFLGTDNMELMGHSKFFFTSLKIQPAATKQKSD